MGIWQQILLTALGCGGLYTLIQFLITRWDEKKGKKKALMDSIEAMKQDIEQLREELSEDRATHARIRILRFNDEILHKLRHSKESFDQVHHDIDAYRKYCNTHPNYHNNKGRQAIENIERVYAQCLEENDFLV